MVCLLLSAPVNKNGDAVFIVTGGGSGIGKALALTLASNNQSVLIVGRREQVLQETATLSPRIRYVCADVSDPVGRQKILEHLSDVKKIDGLVHNAAVVEPIVPINKIDLKEWQQALATNLEAPLFLTQQLQTKLDQSRILHIGSGAAHFPVEGWVAYCVSKAGLYMLTQCWQLEFPQAAFASVKPGIIDTDMQEIIRNTKCMNTEKLDFFIQLKRRGQLVSPETVALFLCWLLLKVSKERYVEKEWDIYDRSHHQEWLPPTHTVPTWSEE